MKKIFAFLLLLIFIFSATASKELLKLQVLMKHYYGHRGENKSIGFISFLTMHYYSVSDTDSDAEEDRQLPFKSTECPPTVSFISLTPPLSIEVITKLGKENIQSFEIHTALFLPSQYLAAIWQPPRYC